jgi:DNA-binding transcriptional LysR family regulator
LSLRAKRTFDHAADRSRFPPFGAAALGRCFRIYSALMVLAMLAAGAAVGTQIGAIAQGLPTPSMGLVERVSVYAPMVWMSVFALSRIHQTRRQADAPLMHAA